MPCINSLNPQLYKYFLKGANLVLKENDVEYRGVHLPMKNLIGANLENSKLQDANFMGANLQYANIQKVDLQNSQLQEAKFQYANLSSSNLWGSDMWNTNLQYTNTHNTILWAVDLQGADLSTTINLDQAVLNNAKYSTSEFTQFGITCGKTKFSTNFSPKDAWMTEQNHL